MKTRRHGFAAQVRVTGAENLPAHAPRRERRRYNSRVVIINHLDALVPEARAVVLRLVAQRGGRVTDVVVVSPTEAIVP